MIRVARGIFLTVALLLSACVLPGNDRFAPHDETKTQENPTFESLVVRATLSGGGVLVRLDAKATNEGPHTYKVSSICTPSWSDSLVSPLGEVHRTPPRMYCAAFGLKAFPPGESIPFNATWDGRLWDLEREDYVDAAPGTYSWHLGFEAFGGGESGADYETRDTIRLQFTVHVQ